MKSKFATFALLAILAATVLAAPPVSAASVADNQPVASDAGGASETRPGTAAGQESEAQREQIREQAREYSRRSVLEQRRRKAEAEAEAEAAPAAVPPPKRDLTPSARLRLPCSWQ